jgi:hypothetical protein
MSPRLEHAPLFAHEPSGLTKGESNGEGSSRYSSSSTPLQLHSQPASRIDNSAIEDFPTETEKILQQIETTKLRVEDETAVKGSPASPVVNSKHGLATPPSSNGASPALDSISEEELTEVPEAVSTSIGEPVEVSPQETSQAKQDSNPNGLPQEDSAQEMVVQKVSPNDRMSLESPSKHPHSLTPSKDSVVKDKNSSFFQSFWRLVFVDFFDGFFASFCGSRRRE